MGVDQLAVDSDADPLTRRIAGQGRSGGDETIGHQGEKEAVRTLQPIARAGLVESHTWRGEAGQLLVVKTQAATIVMAPCWIDQLGKQGGPVPVTPAAKESEETQTDRVKGRRSQMGGEALSQVRTPGREVNQTQNQIEVIQTLEILWRLDVVRR